MAKIIAIFVKKEQFFVVFQVINISAYIYFSILSRMNCYAMCLLNYSCHLIRDETYISNITSFPAPAVFMFTNVRIKLLFA